MITSVGQFKQSDSGAFLKMWRTNVDPATRILQDHRHGNYEIAMVTEGEGVYHTVCGVYPIRPGDVFVFPSNEPHWILEIMPCGLEIFNLHFDHKCFQEGCSISKSYPNLFYAHSSGFCSRIEGGAAGQLRYLIGNIRRELETDAPERETFIHSYLNMLFAELIRNHSYYLPEDGTHTAAAKIQPSLKFIDEHFAEDISLEQIAAVSGLSPYYFTRLFRECFRIKLWDHVLSKRIDSAKKLLNSDSELTILEIALCCGFHNTTNFNRAFLRFTGLTPSEYKKGVPLH